MVKDGDNGVLVEPEPAEMASALRMLASDDDLRRRMGLASRALAEKEHDATANWGRILDLMKEIAGPSRATGLAGPPRFMARVG